MYSKLCFENLETQKINAIELCAFVAMPGGYDTMTHQDPGFTTIPSQKYDLVFPVPYANNLRAKLSQSFLGFAKETTSATLYAI